MEHTTITPTLNSEIRCAWCTKPAITIHRSGTLLCAFHATLFLTRTGDSDDTPARAQPPEDRGGVR